MPKRASTKSKEEYSSARMPWNAVLVVQAIMVIVLFRFPLAYTAAHVDRNYNEGWNAYRQQMAADGIPLYGQPPRYTATNYPPLSFHLIGLLGTVTGNMNATGRWVSVVALLLCSLSIAGIARRISGDWRAGAYGALCFLLWFDAYFETRVGVNDPQLFGTVFALAGLCAYVRWPESARGLTVSAIAFAIGLFIKLNLLAFPLAVGAHLLLRRSWKSLAVWTGALAVSCIALFALAAAVDGRYILTHLFVQPSVDWMRAWASSAAYWSVFRAPIGACAAWSLWNAKSTLCSVLVQCAAIALALAIVFSGGSGVDVNVFTDFTIVLAIVVGIGACDLARLTEHLPVPALLVVVALIPLMDPETALAILVTVAAGALVFRNGRLAEPRILTAAMFVLLLSVATLLPLESIRQAVVTRPPVQDYERGFESGIEFLRARPGLALCESLLMCYEAGKPLFYDAHGVSLQVATGRLKEDELDRLLESGVLRTIEIDGADIQPKRRLRFSAAFMRKLLERYTVAVQNSQSTLLVPR
jgi:hypothetical protein